RRPRIGPAPTHAFFKSPDPGVQSVPRGAGNQPRTAQRQPTMQSDRPPAAAARPVEWWPAPAAPETPAPYNGVAVRQFRRAGARPPGAILVLSPGFTGGINLLDYLAEEVTAACGGR